MITELRRHAADFRRAIAEDYYYRLKPAAVIRAAEIAKSLEKAADRIALLVATQAATVAERDAWKQYSLRLSGRYRPTEIMRDKAWPGDAEAEQLIRAYLGLAPKPAPAGEAKS